MKTNSFLLAAIFGFASAFTLSCSDDDGGESTAACKYKINSIEICNEGPGKDKDVIKEECEFKVGTYYDSCPSGYTLKCKGYGGDDYNFYYVYSDSYKDCDSFCNDTGCK